MKNNARQLASFLTVDLWQIRLRDLPRKKFFLFKLLRIVVLAFRGFQQNQAFFKASALTFYTILSVVPIVALLFAVARGFGYEKILQDHLTNYMTQQGQANVAERIIAFSDKLLSETNSGVLAGAGAFVLFWSVIKMMTNIERFFNSIWGVTRGRSLFRRFTYYPSLMLTAPILLILSISLNVLVHTQLAARVSEVPVLSYIAPLILVVAWLLPYAIGWILFTFVYMLMPNTRVRFVPALTAGIVAGTLFQLVQWGYVTFQIGVAHYSKIYGGFAAVPLFLTWLQMSWLVVLFGSEFAFAQQNVHLYEFEPGARNVSRSFRDLVSLRIVEYLTKRFRDGEPPVTGEEISRAIEVPIRLTSDLLFQLVRAGVLIETKERDDRLTGYQPARDSEALTTWFVISALEKAGEDNVPVEHSKEIAKLRKSLGEFDQAREHSSGNALLRDV